jgi:hypothetical protein
MTEKFIENISPELEVRGTKLAGLMRVWMLFNHKRTYAEVTLRFHEPRSCIKAVPLRSPDREPRRSDAVQTPCGDWPAQH